MSLVDALFRLCIAFAILTAFKLVIDVVEDGEPANIAIVVAFAGSVITALTLLLKSGKES